MKLNQGQEFPTYVNQDELKLLEKYRECLEKLKPGQSGVGRSWSFPLVESSGDQINVSVTLSHQPWEPKSSSAEVIIEGARAHLRT